MLNKTVAICNLQCTNYTCKFIHTEYNNIQLIHLLICWLLKTKWILAGQKEDANFTSNIQYLYNDPELLDTSTSSMLAMMLNLNGWMKINLVKKRMQYHIISKFSLNFSNIDLINAGTLLLNNIYDILNVNERKILRDALDEFKHHLLIDSNDASAKKLKYMFTKASEYFDSYYK